MEGLFLVAVSRGHSLVAVLGLLTAGLMEPAKENARTNARPAALQFGLNRIPGHLSKGWARLLSEAL